MEIKTFEIWREGYITNGGCSPAIHIGISSGETFKDAVIEHYAKKPSGYFDRETVTFWGCRHYEKEADARASFG